MHELLADLSAEHDDLDALVAPLDEAGWRRPTPAEGWDVLDCVAHLAYFDDAAFLAATDAAAFEAELAVAAEELDGYVRRPLERAHVIGPAIVLDEWREARRRLVDAFAGLDPAARVPWYGPPMAVRSSATARLMETWAHGQDVADALGVHRLPTERLRHVAHLGVRTRRFSYVNRGLEPPAGDVRVELASPAGDTWTWGDEAAADRVSGPALDFCLVVTQRRHLADTALVVAGPLAAGWMEVAQAFAGPPGPGRAPRRAVRRGR